MSILFDSSANTLTLHTANTTYQMQVNAWGRLIHLYYGRKIGQDCLDGLYPLANKGFSTDYYETRVQQGLASPDTLPQEYTGFNVGDYRLSALEVTAPGGMMGADFLYTGHRIERGKYSLEGLPAAHDEGEEAETLVVTLEDPVIGLRLELLYGVFERQDMLTRAARLTNISGGNMVLDKAASVCLDIPFGQWDLLHFHGRHAMERQAERRPVLINNWEATFFHFDSEKIYSIARQAAELGVELMVLDDGWFGKRDDDNSGLGDWYVNEGKLSGGLAPLIDRIHGLGMKFGLWVEPEMVSEDSDLYRAHPDWALKLPGRAPAMCRNQLVLDLGRADVVDYLIDVLSGLLGNHKIDYIKWDMNRNLSDVYSGVLPAERQGEAVHRYMLGVYRLLETVTTAFPDVLFEGCAGGGGRFDAGMLAYFPQIWCSDDTDAVERLAIQHGTSFGYPVSSVGSHVSVSPNQQTGRSTLFGTRGVVAMSGTFGYELNPNELTEQEKDAVREQIAYFKSHYDLIQYGDYYRLTDASGDFTAWQYADLEGTEALASLVLSHPRANAAPLHLTLKGLREDFLYRIDDCRIYCGENAHVEVSDKNLKGRVYTGAALMYAGITLPQMFGDSPSIQIHIVRVR